MSALATGVTMPTAVSLAEKAEAAVPRKGGLFRLGLGGTDLRQNAVLRYSLGDTLTDIGPDGQVRAALADNIEHDPAFIQWVFDLRRGVTFHNSRSLSADHVVTSLQSAAGLDNVKSIRASSPHQVIVKLNRRDPQFAHQLAQAAYIIVSQDASLLSGSGAYQMHTIKHGVLTLSRNQNDWHPARGHFNQLMIAAMPQALTRQTAITNGEVDFVDQIDPTMTALLERAPGVNLHTSTGFSSIELQTNFAMHEEDAAVLRQSFRDTIDLAAVKKQALLGYAATDPDHTDFQNTLYKDQHRGTRQSRTLTISVTARHAATPAMLEAITEAAESMGYQLVEAAQTDSDLWLAETPTLKGAGSHIVSLCPDEITAHASNLTGHRDTDQVTPLSAQKITSYSWFT